MTRKILGRTIFIFVFFLPVSWYLFLQFFGSNKFYLPEHGTWDNTCINSELFVAVSSNAIVNKPNDYNRVVSNLKKKASIALLEFEKESCELVKDMYLVDHERKIRGFYNLDREGVDQLLVEVDIYLVNQNGK